MPDDRFIHRRAGHSQKVNLLTDLEHRVWIQYVLSADDFGVMRATHHPLQNDNDHLANRSAKVVQGCLDKLAQCGLIRRFEHQGKSYVYQHDWQTWQKVAYPRATTQPCPPHEALTGCDEATRKLFGLHPGGAGRIRQEHSQNVPGIVLEDSSLMRVGGRAKRLTANGLGERLEANGDSAAELPSDPTPPVMTFPTIGNVRSWDLPRSRVDGWAQAYPALDVLAECRKAYAWIEANPSRRKTAGGMPRFLVTWLNRAVDSGGGSRVPALGGSRRPAWAVKA